jgi:hypothetical protein
MQCYTLKIFVRGFRRFHRLRGQGLIFNSKGFFHAQNLFSPRNPRLLNPLNNSARRGDKSGVKAQLIPKPENRRIEDR